MRWALVAAAAALLWRAHEKKDGFYSDFGSGWNPMIVPTVNKI
jgi:hypothetical protein